jgi:hypothetical protein
MKTAPHFISAHRVTRFTTWAKLWLQWFAAVLPLLLFHDPARVRRELARSARMAANLVVLHAARRLGPLRPRRRPPIKRAGMLRALKGSRLRRRLRARDPAARFFAILAVMRDLDAEAARLVRHLPRGLTRLRAIPPGREHAVAPPLSCFGAICAHADTS